MTQPLKDVFTKPSTHQPRTDEEAAWRVTYKFNMRASNPRQMAAERELISLMGTYPFCEDQIRDVMNLADILFFEEKLRSKVQWRWADMADRRAIGTTGLREVEPGEFMTQITLSRPVLQSDEYDQRLVLSTILHEAIHSYLFIWRGYVATLNGGHSEGFKEIAQLIDDWVGDQQFLQLHKMEAVLENFRSGQKKPSRPRSSFLDKPKKRPYRDCC